MKDLRATGRETVKTASVVFVVTHAKLDFHHIWILRRRRHKKIQLLTWKTRAEGATAECSESTNFSKKGTASTTSCAACMFVFEIRSNLWYGNQQRVQKASEKINFIPAVEATSTCEEQDKNVNTADLGEPRSFPTADPNVAFAAKLTYRIRVCYSRPVKAIQTAVALLDTGPGVKLFHSALIYPWWRNSVKKMALPRLQTAPKKLFLFERLMILHIYFGDRFTPVCFIVSTQLAANMLLGCPFVDDFIR